ncbi:MAG: hypothetical protein PHS34_08315 [Candidatus Omnitrophica bacterium]|nr:hypothetical protein [Candidatus Omnitrophota bacterium]
MTFNSKELQEIDIKSQEIIERASKKLDVLSSDIRLLEKKLSNYCLPFTFLYAMTIDTIETGEINRHHYLVWDIKIKRILYQKYLTESYDINGYELEMDKTKPTLEYSNNFYDTPAIIRIKYFKYLKYFYISLIKNLDNFENVLSKFVFDKSEDYGDQEPPAVVFSSNIKNARK